MARRGPLTGYHFCVGRAGARAPVRGTRPADRPQKLDDALVALDGAVPQWLAVRHVSAWNLTLNQTVMLQFQLRLEDRMVRWVVLLI